MRTILIVIHAAAGTVAFGTGAHLVALARSGRPLRWFRAYFAALAVMTTALLAAVAVDWAGQGTGARTAFAALCILAAVMLLRAAWAKGLLTPASTRDRQAFINHVGFTLIALFDGFVIVSAIDLAAPVWLVVAVGAAGVVFGHYAIAATAEAISAP